MTRGDWGQVQEHLEIASFLHAHDPKAFAKLSKALRAARRKLAESKAKRRSKSNR